MINQGTVMATVAVKDIAAAKAFYGEKLGLTQVDENPGGVTYQSGDSKLFVYPSAFAGTNQATYATWMVDDVASVVADLKAKGIMFEVYPDLPETTWEGEIASWGPMKSAWFKDPDGNVFSVSSK